MTSRRDALRLLVAGTAASLVPPHLRAEDERSSGWIERVPVTTPAGRVVVVGGGMAGAACAKYLRLWGGTGVQVTLVDREPFYNSNIMSNLVLTGQLAMSSLRYTWTALEQRYAGD